MKDLSQIGMMMGKIISHTSDENGVPILTFKVAIPEKGRNKYITYTAMGVEE